MQLRTRRRLALTLAALAFAFVAGGRTARFDVDARVARADAPLAKASLEVGVAGATVLVNYALSN